MVKNDFLAPVYFGGMEGAKRVEKEKGMFKL